VGGIFNSANKNVYAAREDMNSARNRYILKDVQDNARAAGLHIVFPPKVFPVNSVKVMRGCLWIAQDTASRHKYLAFIEATFAAYFTREEDISQDAVLQAICAQVGIDAAAFMQGITRPDIKEQLKSNTDDAVHSAYPLSSSARICISAMTGWRWSGQLGWAAFVNVRERVLKVWRKAVCLARPKGASAVGVKACRLWLGRRFLRLIQLAQRSVFGGDAFFSREGVQVGVKAAVATHCDLIFKLVFYGQLTQKRCTHCTALG
jgi:hypothetical protein